MPFLPDFPLRSPEQRETVAQEPGAASLGLGRLPAQSPDIRKPFPKTNPFQRPALKLTHLAGGEARARG